MDKQTFFSNLYKSSSSTNGNPQGSNKCLTTRESQPSRMPLKNNVRRRRRHNSLLFTRPAARTRANSFSTNDLCLIQSIVEGCSTGTPSVEENSSRLQQENAEFIVPEYEAILPSPTSYLEKEEPEENAVVEEEEDTNDEFDPQLQSSMEMIFECEDHHQQHDRDPTVSHADSTVGTKNVLTLFEDTRLSLTGLKTCYEEEITKRNQQIEDLKRQIEELKRNKKECKFCHFISNASPEVTTFMKNLLTAMEANKDSPVQHNESQALLCHSSADVNAQSGFHNRMNDSRDVVCHSSAERNVQSRSAKRMVPLYPGTDVMISEEAKCLAILRANGNPKKLISCILRTLFTKEELSGFSVCGQRENKPFPPNVTAALKMFVLTTCKMDNGLSPLNEREFHRILNARFGIARRAFKKVV